MAQRLGQWLELRPEVLGYSLLEQLAMPSARVTAQPVV